MTSENLKKANRKLLELYMGVVSGQRETGNRWGQYVMQTPGDLNMKRIQEKGKQKAFENVYGGGEWRARDMERWGQHVMQTPSDMNKKRIQEEVRRALSEARPTPALTINMSTRLETLYAELKLKLRMKYTPKSDTL